MNRSIKSITSGWTRNIQTNLNSVYVNKWRLSTWLFLDGTGPSCNISFLIYLNPSENPNGQSTQSQTCPVRLKLCLNETFKPHSAKWKSCWFSTHWIYQEINDTSLATSCCCRPCVGNSILLIYESDISSTYTYTDEKELINRS